jgi:hypothetical protein
MSAVGLGEFVERLRSGTEQRDLVVGPIEIGSRRRASRSLTRSSHIGAGENRTTVWVRQRVTFGVLVGAGSGRGVGSGPGPGSVAAVVSRARRLLRIVTMRSVDRFSTHQ